MVGDCQFYECFVTDRNGFVLVLVAYNLTNPGKYAYWSLNASEVFTKEQIETLEYGSRIYLALNAPNSIIAASISSFKKDEESAWPVSLTSTET